MRMLIEVDGPGNGTGQESDHTGMDTGGGGGMGVACDPSPSVGRYCGDEAIGSIVDDGPADDGGGGTKHAAGPALRSDRTSRRQEATILVHVDCASFSASRRRMQRQSSGRVA